MSGTTTLQLFGASRSQRYPPAAPPVAMYQSLQCWQMARGGKDGERQVGRKQDLGAQREAKRAKVAQDKSAGNQLRAEKARTERSRVRAAADGGDAGSKAKLKAEAQRKAAARTPDRFVLAFSARS